MVRLQIENRDITDQRVLDAMRSVPRHIFVPPGSRATAYADFPVPIGHGQTISQPYMVAFMTQALCLSGPEKVLEIGTGSGYQTAVLSVLTATVYTVERIPALAAVAERAIGSLGLTNVFFRTGDGGPAGQKRLPLTASSSRLPPRLFPRRSRASSPTTGCWSFPLGIGGDPR